MVPGHTKFEPDSLFSQIANRFYKTDIFDTNDLLHVVGACNAVPHELSRRYMRQWKTSLAGKYRDIPKITEWNFMVVEEHCTNGHPDNVSVQVKRSVSDESFSAPFPGGANSMLLLRSGSTFHADGAPGLGLSAAVDESMRRPLRGQKLKSMLEMYESYIPLYRWPRQLTDALHATEHIPDEAGNLATISVPQNAEFDAQSVRVGAAMGVPEAAARAHTFLRRTNGSDNIADSALIQALESRPHSGVRTLPRRKRSK